MLTLWIDSRGRYPHLWVPSIAFSVVEEYLDHILGCCKFSNMVWDSLTCGSVAWGVLSQPTPWGEGSFSLACRVRAILWVVYVSRNNRVFRGVERDPCKIWSLVWYHVSLWASNSKVFCNYSISIILHSWSPFLQRVLLFLWFFVVLVFFHFFLMEVDFSSNIYNGDFFRSFVLLVCSLLFKEQGCMNKKIGA